MTTEPAIDYDQAMEAAYSQVAAAGVTAERLQRMGRISRRSQRAASADSLTGSIPGQYYRNRDGWITFAEGIETLQAQRKVLRKGWSELPGFEHVRLDVNRWRDARGRENFEPLLRAGGAGLFPVEQIVALGWHRTPPRYLVCKQPLQEYVHPEHTPRCYREAEFPQMKGVTVHEVACSFCGPGRRFVSTESREQAETLLRMHMQVMHKEHLVNSELVIGLRDALAPLVGAAPVSGDVEAQSSLAVEQITQIVAATTLTILRQFGLAPAESSGSEEERRRDAGGQGAARGRRREETNDA